MSPVERWGMPCSLAASLAWVPLPAPGGPRKITARFSPATTGPGRSGIAAAPQLALFDKAFVVAHDQLGVDLLHGVHGHADHDQERGATEIEGDAQTLENEAPHVVIEPGADGAGNVLQVNSGDHPLRDQANGRQVHTADKGEPAQDAVDVLGSVAPRADARHEPAVL